MHTSSLFYGILKCKNSSLTFHCDSGVFFLLQGSCIRKVLFRIFVSNCFLILFQKMWKRRLVHECPKTEDKVNLSRIEMGCGSDEYGNNQYMCLPHEDLGYLVEFCYRRAMGIQEEGKTKQMTRFSPFYFWQNQKCTYFCLCFLSQHFCYIFNYVLVTIYVFHFDSSVSHPFNESS